MTPTRCLFALLSVGMLIVSAPVQAADVPARAITMAEPAPDWDNPRRILLQVSGEPEALDRAMSNAMNIQAFYGADHVVLEIVAIGPGVRALLSESASAPERVSSLQSYGIGFVACGNTLDTIGKAEADLLPGIRVVSTGYVEVVERNLEGWVVIKP